MKCESCGCHIEDAVSPWAMYLAVGPDPAHADRREAYTDYALGAEQRAVLATQRQRIERCATCRAYENGEDLVTGPAATPTVVVKRADHATRETFHAAANAFHASQATKRAAARVAAEKAAAEKAAAQAAPRPAPPVTTSAEAAAHE